MGIPFYGQTYTLQSKSNANLNAPTQGPGRSGQFSLQPGFLTYFEICGNGKPNHTSSLCFVETFISESVTRMFYMVPWHF